jgi:hypothetical protein
MAEVIAIAVGIGTAVVSAATAVAAVVATVASVVASAVATAAAWIWSAVTVIYTAVAEAVVDFVAGFEFTATAGFQGLSVAGESFFVQVGAYVGSVVYYVGAFLEAIHFSTILTIHEIAYIVSDDYRAMWSKVYSEMGEISYALGYSADFLNIIIRDSRNVVLDASAMMGQKYDLAEVTWVKSFQSYLKVFSDQASKYTKNPGAVFYDIDRMLTKPAVDNKAGIMQTVFVAIDSTVKFTKATVDQVEKLRVDTGKLIADLPGDIRNTVKPWLDDILKGWDKWIREDYKPSLKVLDATIKALDIETGVNAARQKDLANRLKKPGDYLREIDRLPKDEREDQERKITDITLRAWEDEAAYWSAISGKSIQETLEMKRAMAEERERVEWEIPEIETPERPASAPVEPRVTWFVGDF